METKNQHCHAAKTIWYQTLWHKSWTTVERSKHKTKQSVKTSQLVPTQTQVGQCPVTITTLRYNLYLRSVFQIWAGITSSRYKQSIFTDQFGKSCLVYLWNKISFFELQWHTIIRQLISNANVTYDDRCPKNLRSVVQTQWCNCQTNIYTTENFARQQPRSPPRAHTITAMKSNAYSLLWKLSSLANWGTIGLVLQLRKPREGK